MNKTKQEIKQRLIQIRNGSFITPHLSRIMDLIENHAQVPKDRPISMYKPKHKNNITSTALSLLALSGLIGITILIVSETISMYQIYNMGIDTTLLSD